MLDDLVHAQPVSSDWWEPRPSRSSVIRAAIARAHEDLRVDRAVAIATEIPGQTSIEDAE